MISVELHGNVLFEDIEDARVVARGIDALIKTADVQTGGVIIRDGLNLRPLRDERFRGKVVTGFQEARGLADQYVKEIELLAKDETPAGFWEDLYTAARESGRVDYTILNRLAQERLDLHEPLVALPEIIGKVAAANARREMRPAPQPKQR